MNAHGSMRVRPGLAEIRVGGLERLSLCDWPGELVATVFLQGCPWNCGYCHNPHLIPVRGDSSLDWSQVLDFLSRRRNLLDGVVFSGGEPTLQKSLPDAIRAVRGLGFRIGLHTGGAYPARLSDVLPWVDWVGFDVKAPFQDYDGVTGAGGGERARESLRLLLQSGVAHEVRTTIHPALLDEAAQARMAEELAVMGVADWKRQAFRSDGCTPAALAALKARADVH